MDLLIQTDLAAFQHILARYIALTGKLPAEVVRQKAQAIGFQLYRAFRGRQWGGDPKRVGIARAELDARVAQGRGIRVRPSVRRTMNERSLQLGARLSAIMLRSRSGRSRAKDADSAARYRAEFAHRWREAVRRELSIRERGIGYMATAFRIYRRFPGRRRIDTAPIEQPVESRRGRLIGTYTAGDESASIMAQVPGIATLAARHGLLSSAIQAETADTLDYLRRRFRDIMTEARAGASSTP
jgi:hypothetical protein